MATTRQMALKICQEVLTNQKTSTPENIYVINYILNSLFDLLQYEEKKKYVSVNIGLSCMLLIPEDLRSSYNHLINSPLLIVEQLLMNLKVGILSQVLSYIRSELEQSYATCMGVLASQCDDLLGKYASSSLKMSTVQVASKYNNSFICVDNLHHYWCCYISIDIDKEILGSVKITNRLLETNLARSRSLLIARAMKYFQEV